MAKLRLYTLGSTKIKLEGQTVSVDRRKAFALLVYLAFTGETHRREALATLLWPEYDQSKAYAYLRRSLWEIKHALGEGWLRTDRDLVGLNPNADLWFDVNAFLDKVAQSRVSESEETEISADSAAVLLEAIDLYGGDFLAGFTLQDSPGFDEWQFFQVEALRRKYSNVLYHLIVYFRESHRFDQAIVYARRWIALDPLDERAHRQLMRLYAYTGQRNAALRQFRQCVRILDEELNIPPEAATTALNERIRVGEIEPQSLPRKQDERAHPDRHEPEAVPVQHNLPLALTAFIGREQEVAEIEQLMGNPDCRLLTLVGPGGVGKTRLAVHLASRHLDRFPQGVFFAPLAAIHSPSYIIPVIADNLGLSLGSNGDSPKQRFLDYLRERRLLLVMDNFEHLVEGAGVLTEILIHAKEVKILATSRERLNLLGEWVFELRGMDFPQASHRNEIDSGDAVPSDGDRPFDSYSAVALFMESARRVRAGFHVTETDKAAIGYICQLVEGMPLGVELAAAWVKMLSPGDIAREIERSVDFLETSRRDIPERHQSLRAVFEHSWNLLDDIEKKTLRALSVFHGAFPREAAVEVSGTSLLVLSSLMDKSLIRQTSTGRYAIHELVRQFAAEKLAEDPAEAARVQADYGGYYGSFLRDKKYELKGRNQSEAIRDIRLDFDNTHAAWMSAVGRNDYNVIRMSAEGLFLYTMLRSAPNPATLFELAVERIQAASENQPDDDNLRSLRGFLVGLLARGFLEEQRFEEGMNALHRSLRILSPLEPSRHVAITKMMLIHDLPRVDDGQALDFYNECLDIFNREGDPWDIALTHFTLGNRLHWQAKLVEARPYYELCLRALREIGDKYLTTYCLRELGDLSYGLGDDQEAKRLWRQGLEIARGSGDPWSIQTYLHSLGIVTRERGEYREALVHTRESLQLAREFGNQKKIADELDNLGYLLFLMEDYDQARACYADSLRISNLAGDQRGLAYSKQNLGDVARAEGDYQEAKRYYRESYELFKALAHPFGMIIARKKAGHTAVAQGDLDQADQAYQQALAFAIQMAEYREMLEILSGIAEVLAQGGDIERAVELLTLAQNHPNTNRPIKDRATQLLVRLREYLSEARFKDAVSVGKSADLEEVVASLTGK